MSIQRRRSLIVKFLASGAASTQEEIVDALAQAGERATQATVSRDLVALGAVRGPRGYQIADSVPSLSSVRGSDKGAVSAQELEQARLIRAHALSIELAHSIVVIKTAPGHAQLLASGLDRTPPKGVVGCVGGDDTIFLATGGPQAAKHVTKSLRALLTKDPS